MIISNWHQHNLNKNALNMTTTPSNFNASHDFISKEIFAKEEKKTPRTIVFCRIKTPSIYSKSPISSTGSNKLKKLVKFDDNSHRIINKKTSISNDSKTQSTDALLTNKNLNSNSVNDLKKLKPDHQHKINVNKAISKKLLVLNRFNSSNSFNRLNLKDNIHTSYLTNGGSVITNPFASNLDMISKTNPNFSSLSSKLVSRYDSSRFELSRLDLYSSQTLFKQKSKDTPSETNYNPDYVNKVIESMSKNDESSNLSFSRIGMLTNEQNKINSSNDKSEKKSNNQEANYFLNYRLIKSDKENILNNIRLNNEYKNSLKSKAHQTTQQQPSKFDEESSNEFNDNKYLESFKYYYIKNWVEDVEKCHRSEGKCLETMNKIVCYDD